MAPTRWLLALCAAATLVGVTMGQTASTEASDDSKARAKHSRPPDCRVVPAAAPPVGICRRDQVSDSARRQQPCLPAARSPPLAAHPSARSPCSPAACPSPALPP